MCHDHHQRHLAVIHCTRTLSTFVNVLLKHFTFWQRNNICIKTVKIPLCVFLYRIVPLDIHSKCPIDQQHIETHGKKNEFSVCQFIDTMSETEYKQYSVSDQTHST